jgi:hypothetical protein
MDCSSGKAVALLVLLALVLKSHRGRRLKRGTGGGTSRFLKDGAPTP